MKPKEFYEIMGRFVEEEKRWRALNEGDVIYEERCGGIDFDYFKMIIREINIDERLVTVIDTSMRIPTTKKISSFLTQQEFDKKIWKIENHEN